MAAIIVRETCAINWTLFSRCLICARKISANHTVTENQYLRHCVEPTKGVMAYAKAKRSSLHFEEF